MTKYLEEQQPEKKKRGRPKKATNASDVASSPKENKTKPKGRPKGSQNRVNKAKPKKEKPLTTQSKPLPIILDGNKQLCPVCEQRTMRTEDIEVAGEHCELKFTKVCTSCGNYGFIVKRL